MDPTSVLLLVLGSWTIGYMLGWLTSNRVRRRPSQLVVGEETLNRHIEKKRRKEMW